MKIAMSFLLTAAVVFVLIVIGLSLYEAYTQAQTSEIENDEAAIPFTGETLTDASKT